MGLRKACIRCSFGCGRCRAASIGPGLAIPTRIQQHFIHTFPEDIKAAACNGHFARPRVGPSSQRLQAIACRAVGEGASSLVSRTNGATNDNPKGLDSAPGDKFEGINCDFKAATTTISVL